MLRVKFVDGSRQTVSDGLTQWDYGQLLCVEGMTEVESAEIHFACKGKQKALIVETELDSGKVIAKIPDELLSEGEEIQAYIYAVTSDSGKTIYTVVIPVKRREKPEDYSEPEHQDKLKEIIDKLNKKADDLQYEDGYLQLLSGTAPIGERVRLNQSSGREIELKNDGAAICWRYTDSNEWTELVKLNDLKGKDGETPEFEIKSGHLYAIYEN